MTGSGNIALVSLMTTIYGCHLNMTLLLLLRFFFFSKAKVCEVSSVAVPSVHCTMTIIMWWQIVLCIVVHCDSCHVMETGLEVRMMTGSRVM